MICGFLCEADDSVRAEVSGTLVCFHEDCGEDGAEAIIDVMIEAKKRGDG